MSVDLSKRIVVLPPSLFLFLFSLFIYFYKKNCGLIGSFYLSLICPLWDNLICPLLGSFVCTLWDLFLTLRSTLYILQEVQKIFTLYKKYSTYGKLSNGTSGGASNLLAQEDLELICGGSSLEYTSQVLQCKDPTTAICMNDNLYGVQILNEHECGSFKKNSSVAPFSLSISFFSFYIFL